MNAFPATIPVLGMEDTPSLPPPSFLPPSSQRPPRDCAWRLLPTQPEPAAMLLSS